MILKRIKDFSLELLLIAPLLLLSLILNTTYVLRPHQLKPFLSKIYKPPLKQTLQRLEEVPMSALGLDLRILKVKSKNKIQLEFLSKQEDNSYSVINTLELKGSREAYFSQRVENRPPSSLLVFDSDGDGIMEVLAPTFNSFFFPYMNIAFYNKQTKRFELKNKALPKIIPRS